MLIFIPMTGTGDRYLRAGYTQPKPLVPVDGKPMIERVLDAFPADAKYLFGVNRMHAETTDVLAVLRALRPQAKVVVMDGHKDGPVRTILEAADAIPDDEDICVNYCDFGVTWSFPDFREWLDRGNWDGAMSAYRGFHPHSLGPTLYAYMRSEGDKVLEIREKHHFTANKFEEYASSGLYWFRRGGDLKRLARELIAKGDRVNNEFYASMLMQLLIEQSGRVGVFELERFFQWGTPEDLQDYEAWGRALRGVDGFLADAKAAKSDAVQVFPMAGLGQRFIDQGYRDSKPLIDVAGKPMIQQAIDCLPSPTERVLIAREEQARDARFRKAVSELTRETRIIELDRVTEGQAITAKIGVDTVDPRQPVLIAPCDTGYIYDVATWLAEERSDADLIVWGATHHLPAIWRPQMYGWIHAESGFAKSIAVKRQVEGVAVRDQAVVCGTFWFRSGELFLREVADLVRDDDRVNNEFYIDTIARRMVARGAKVRVFLVDKYIPWGTPEELKTFTYWNAVHRAGAPLAAR